eukprot:g5349.t1
MIAGAHSDAASVVEDAALDEADDVNTSVRDDLLNLLQLSRQDGQFQRQVIHELQHKASLLQTDNDQLRDALARSEERNGLLVKRCNGLVEELVKHKTSLRKAKADRDKLANVAAELKQALKDELEYGRNAVEAGKEKYETERKKAKRLASALRVLQRDMFVEKMRRGLAEEAAD